MQYTPLHHIPSLPPSPYDPAPYASAMAFDPYADVLFVGTSAGSVMDYCSPLSLVRHINYQAHGTRGFGQYSTTRIGYGAGEVKQLRVSDREIWTLGEGGLAGTNRSGAVKWHVSDQMYALRTFDCNPLNSHELVAGGVGTQLLVVNTSQGKIVKKVDQPHSVAKICHLSRSILTATPSGLLQILDPRQNYRPVSVLAVPHLYSGGLTNIDVIEDTVIMWGWNVLQGQVLSSPSLSVYDLRTSRSLHSIEFEPGVSFAKIHPTLRNKALLANVAGRSQLVDLGIATESVSDQQSETWLDLPQHTFLTAMELSPQGDYLALADSSSRIHLMTSHDVSSDSGFVTEAGTLSLPPMNGYEAGRQAEWPDVTLAPPRIEWTDRTPLNVIGLPYYETPLLSNFPPSGYATASSPLLNSAIPIPQAVLADMRTIDGIGYAALPRELKGRRNVVCRDSKTNLLMDSKGETVDPIGAGSRAHLTHRRESEPKFRSEKQRRGEARLVEAEILDAASSLVNGSPHMPKYYRKVEIKYSKFGVEDFDFEFYNKTRHSGLETHILNSYTNSLLQAYHYTVPIRACAKAHITLDCPKEHCMLCEAGFLFRMLEDAEGINCQASNFSRAFSATPQASTLGLSVRDDETINKDYAALIQKFNRWLINTMAAEDALRPTGISLEDHPPMSNSKSDEPQPSHITQVMALRGQTQTRCSSCGQSSSKNFIAHVVDLIYPRIMSSVGSRVSGDFASILQASLRRETVTKANCRSCKRATTSVSKRRYRPKPDVALRTAFPPVISINSSIISEDHLDCWKNKPSVRNKQGRKHFLPNDVYIRLDQDGDAYVLDEDESEEERVDASRYTIRSLIASVQEDDLSEAHLVAFINIPVQDDSNGQSAKRKWLLFNDFLVKEVSQDEALSCSFSWKTPALVIYERIDSAHTLSLSALPNALDPSILLKDSHIFSRRHRVNIKHTCLRKNELPSPGTLVAIDAEFIALQLEELEIRSDGTKNVLRPTKMSLARVSVLRGTGPAESVPFIDDYIHTSEEVVDYLTEFSGIKEGDLEPGKTSHTLVPLKAAYKKLRILVDLGCIFVGHGLPKDFRTINIFVPPAQVIDTVAIFFDPSRHRKLSLRFLSWFLLKQEIQTAEHDSIEDARCALQLYKMYQTFVAEGRFREVMEDIYETGQRLGFKPPQTDLVTGSGFTSTRPPAPSTPDISSGFSVERTAEEAISAGQIFWSTLKRKV